MLVFSERKWKIGAVSIARIAGQTPYPRGCLYYLSLQTLTIGTKNSCDVFRQVNCYFQPISPEIIHDDIL